MQARCRLPPRARSALISALALAAACGRPVGELPRIKTLPEFYLTSVTGGFRPEKVSNADLRGAPWVADFVFTSCSGPCPMLTLRMASLQRSLPPAVRLVSFTVDPDSDSPDRLREYAKENGADSRRWRFVTGDKAALYKLLREGFALPVVADAGQPAGMRVTHSTKFALVDSSLTVRGYYDGQDAEALAALTRDAKDLLDR